MQAVAQRLVIVLLLACWPTLGQAQTFPNGPINIVVPLAPGDAADTTVRLLADEIAKTLHTSVAVTNRPGAGGALGTQTVVQAKKDGQTILFAQNSALTFRPVIEPQSVSYDTVRDFVPLGCVGHRSRRAAEGERRRPGSLVRRIQGHGRRAAVTAGLLRHRAALPLPEPGARRHELVDGQPRLQSIERVVHGRQRHLSGHSTGVGGPALQSALRRIGDAAAGADPVAHWKQYRVSARPNCSAFEHRLDLHDTSL